MRKKVFFLFVAAAVLAGCGTKENGNTGGDGVIPSGRITPGDLIYLGAFRLPEGISETSTWEWGGTAMTFFPDGDKSGSADGFPGSLYGAGHAWEHRISEIDIPVPVVSSGKDPDDLNTAMTLREFTDVLDVSALEIPRTGIEYLPSKESQTEGKLYFCIGQHMEELEKRATHGMINMGLSLSEKQGLWKIGDFLNYVTNDYLFAVPQNWADEYAGGKSLATGRFRDGGQGAMGPSLIVIAPCESGSSPPAGTVLDAESLLLYDSVYLDNPRIMDNYHHSDEWSGGVWVTAGDKAAVIFVGTKGYGDCWYGFSNGVVWDEPYPPVPEFPHDRRGWWSTEFKASFLFYDPSDLAAVANGTKGSWEPQPYECADVGEYLFNGDHESYDTGHGTEYVQRKYRFGGCAYDRDNRILYVFELFADGDKPVIHAWKVQ